MGRIEINNLGIPPLAGICTYEQACSAGYDIEINVGLLKRYNYVSTRLNQIAVAHIARVPEWEVKCALGLHMWLDAEHASMIRKRVSEMREPPLHMDKVPDERLQRLLEETIRAETTVELLTGIYRVVRPALVRALQRHLAETNPLLDHPTCRMLKLILTEEAEMLQWGRQAIEALTAAEAERQAADLWERHLQAFLQHAQGVGGNEEAEDGDRTELPAPRWDGSPYEMDAVPRRDARFTDSFNQSAKIDDYYREESRAEDERTYALLYKRLREMDVPEYMAPIIFNVKDKPWEYYADLSRQLWDEARHAMMGEVGLYQDGIPFYKYPLDLKTSYTANTQLDPLEAHLILLGIELSLMPKDTGKRYEWVVAKASGNELAAAIQDYDWADEVLHTQIGRRWLVPRIGSLEKIQEAVREIWPRWLELSEEKRALSPQSPWWDTFIADIRDSRKRLSAMQAGSAETRNARADQPE